MSDNILSERSLHCYNCSNSVYYNIRDRNPAPGWEHYKGFSMCPYCLKERDEDSPKEEIMCNSCGEKTEHSIHKWPKDWIESYWSGDLACPKCDLYYECDGCHKVEGTRDNYPDGWKHGGEEWHPQYCGDCVKKYTCDKCYFVANNEKTNGVCPNHNPYAAIAWEKTSSIVAKVICDHGLFTDGPQCKNEILEKEDNYNTVNRVWGNAYAWMRRPQLEDFTRLHFCPEHKSLHHVDYWEDDYKKNNGCGELLGKYGQCPICDKQDEKTLKEYSDAWGFDKKASDNSFVCQACCYDKPIDQMNKYKSSVYCNDCYNQFKKREKREYSDAWGFDKKATAEDDKCDLCGEPVDNGLFDLDANGCCMGCHDCEEEVNHGGRAGSCNFCGNSDTEQAKIYRKEYVDAWGFDKKADNFFSLDQPNEAIMPGMAQDKNNTDGLGFGSTSNPESGKEGVPTNSPSMQDYENGLSSAASKKTSYYVVRCDECDKEKTCDDYKEWRDDERTSGTEYAKHFCPDCKDKYCLECGDRIHSHHELESQICDECHYCDETQGKYNQCTRCDGEDEEYFKQLSKEYSDAWSSKESNVKKATRYAVCDDCDKSENLMDWEGGTVHAVNYDRLLGEGGWAQSGYADYCPDCKNKYCPECGDTLEPENYGKKCGKYGQCATFEDSNEKIEDEYSNLWKESSKKFSYYERVAYCDGCDKENPDGDEYPPHNWVKATAKAAKDPHNYKKDKEQHFCDECNDSHCVDKWDGHYLVNSGCGSKLSSYNICRTCKPISQEEYNDAWITKEASALFGAQCDDCGKKEYGLDWYNDSPYGWERVGSINGGIDEVGHYCENCAPKFCTDEKMRNLSNKGLDERDIKYDYDSEGCGTFLKNGRCFRCFPKTKEEKTKEYTDAWKF